MKITIIEDEKILASRIWKKLHRNWYWVSIYNTTNDFRNHHEFNSDLYIIDIWLPDWSGFDLIKWIRNEKKSTIPIIITSWFNDIDNKVYGLDIWADDYLPKPFSAEELLARIRAIIRRQLWSTNTSIIEYKNLNFDLNTKKLTKSNKIIELTKKESSFIEYFLYNKWKLINKTELINSVWWEHEVLSVSDNTINVTVSKVRKKLWETFKLQTRINEWYILED